MKPLDLVRNFKRECWGSWDVLLTCIKHSVTDVIEALPGDSSVNRQIHTHAVNNTVEVFSMWSAPQ
jgi:hypothetical protein